MNAKWRGGGSSPSRPHEMRECYRRQASPPRISCGLLGLDPRFADGGGRWGAVLDEEAAERLRGIEDRLEADIDQALLAKLRVAADAGKLVAPAGATMPK